MLLLLLLLAIDRKLLVALGLRSPLGTLHVDTVDSLCRATRTDVRALTVTFLVQLGAVHAGKFVDLSLPRCLLQRSLAPLWSGR